MTPDAFRPPTLLYLSEEQDLKIQCSELLMRAASTTPLRPDGGEKSWSEARVHQVRSLVCRERWRVNCCLSERDRCPSVLRRFTNAKQMRYTALFLKNTQRAVKWKSRHTSFVFLHQITMAVIRSIERAGFVVVRVVADNHATNRKLFSMLSNGSILPVVEHPLDATRWLFLPFDYCHIIKNVGSQFLAQTRRFVNEGKAIDPKYLRSILDVRQRQKGFKLVRNMTRKHLYPTSFENMNVKRAVDIFKREETSVLRSLEEYGPRLGIYEFEDSEPTIEFLETFFKWHPT
ncbi:hypothetical protein HPB47_010698 [Ixodes persulcatus]|uniref:Uncharacterized protein n=1 Tax=Ixodes persulcatus TaxID=34615 RepID=A0AC60NYG0_IXOPE|nr:hypothetical protein HPB47_010698 [Ixodes persulcatus]